MPFWSESTIKRTIKSLEEQGYLLSANYNRLKMDKTKWYSIDYEKLAELESDAQAFLEPSTGQIDTTLDSRLASRRGQRDPSNTRDYYRDFNRDYNKVNVSLFPKSLHT